MPTRPPDALRLFQPRPDIRKLVEPVRRKADKIRRDEEVTIDQPLTPELFGKLERCFDIPTPDEAIKDDENDYLNVHLIWQVRCMDVLLGRRHWCWRIHFENDQTAHAFILIGNHLAGVRVDPATGELIVPEETELVVAPYEGSGAVGTLYTRGATRKAARTSALRGLLSLIGFGGDVSMLRREYPTRLTPVSYTPPAALPETAGPSRGPAAAALEAVSSGFEASSPIVEVLSDASDASRARLEAVTDPHQRAASRLLLREIRGLAAEREIPASQLATLIAEAMGRTQRTMPEREAEWRVAVMLSPESPVVRLTPDQATTLLTLVERATPHVPVIGPEPEPRDPRAQTHPPAEAA